MSRRLLLLAVLGVVVGIEQIEVSALATQSRPVSSVVIDEMSMRKGAVTKVAPVYPEEAVKARKTGVAVSDVLVDKDGSVILVRVLESPDPSITRSLTDAIRQWKFQPVKAGRGPDAASVDVRTKLTFYFSIDSAGRHSVSDPPVLAGRPAKRGLVEEAEPSQFARLQRSPRSIVIDVRERRDFRARPTEGVKNIPAQELVSRFSELQTAEVVVIDCRLEDLKLCQFAANLLADKGIKRSVIVKPLE